MTASSLTIEAVDIREVRQALHGELGSAAEDLHRAADEYSMLDEEDEAVSNKFSAAKAHLERVLALLDHCREGYGDERRRSRSVTDTSISSWRRLRTGLTRSATS